MRPHLAPFCTFCLLTSGLAQTPQTHRPAHPATQKKVDSPPASALPITRVALYKNGVGFFEHSGRVSGDQTVTIGFTSAQLNDVLQSLTAIDLNGGRISGAAYNSTTPLDEQLKALPLALSGDPSDVDFYNAIRGARVQVSGPGVAITGRILSLDLRTGSRSSLSSRSEASLSSRSEAEGSASPATPDPDHRFLTVVSDAGAVRTFELTAGVTVTLLDTTLHTDVTRYLELLASTRNQGLRHLNLLDRGPEGPNSRAARDLRVSYISEVPVWKSSYRILFTDQKAGASSQTATLQGWSVVDNTTGSDWIDVHLDLIAGAPQSFIQPLSTPYYTRRPEIPLPQEAQLTPQTHESGDLKARIASGIQGLISDPSGATIGEARITVTNIASGAQTNASSDNDGSFAVELSQPGQYRVQVSAPGFISQTQTVNFNGQQVSELRFLLGVGAVSESVEVSSAQASTIGGPLMAARRSYSASGGVIGGVLAGKGSAPAPVYKAGPIDYAAAAQSSLTPQTTTSAFDDYFEYSLTDPITIRKNESALVPILQTKLPVERVTLWSPQQPVALRALWITNASTLTLDRGSFSIVENGSFGGEGLLDPIHPNERRLLSYAADQAVRVSTSNSKFDRRVTHLKIAKGVLTETSSDLSELTYDIRNAAPESRYVVIEHPVRQGWELTSDIKPTETTPATDRFQVAVAPAHTEHLHVAERRTNYEFIRLVDRTEEQLVLLLRNAHASPATLAALEPVFAAHRAVVALDAQIQQLQAETRTISTDQNRLRENMKALKGSPEERALLSRYTGELNAQEDRLNAINKELADLRARRTAADQDFQNKLEAVNLDDAL